MLAYVLKRLLLMVPTLLGVLLVTFAVIQFVPGGPVEQYISEARGFGGVESDNEDAPWSCRGPWHHSGAVGGVGPSAESSAPSQNALWITRHDGLVPHESIRR